MQSFRTEIENPIVEKDILDLEKKIFAFKNGTIDDDRFRSLRLARGVYGQRQQGVQMVRIKIPYGKISAKQFIRIAEVSDKYSNGNLHLTTRQDIQIHHVSLDRTPELWADLEKDNITLREACGNTVRNITASIFAGIDENEVFDPSHYAQVMFEYFLRNPICQEMGRKLKFAFSASESDDAFTFIHDLGFIPKIQNKKRGFKVLVGGGIGSQPNHASMVYEFLDEDQFIPFSEAVIRVFDRHGERNNRNKARMKFLVQKLGIEEFIKLVDQERIAIKNKVYPIEHKDFDIPEVKIIKKQIPLELIQEFENFKKSNVFNQKQKNFLAVGIKITNGDISSDKTRLLAQIIELYTGNDTRLTIGQSILLRFVPKENIEALFLALNDLDLAKIGFHKINDITTCPGTDTCNLGIASSMGLAKELENVLNNEFTDLILQENITIKISGCMNACGQHTIANIGFQGMTIKSGKNIAPATQILLGGGILGNGNGRFADKVMKVPSKRTPNVLRWILNDFKQNKQENETFLNYYDRKQEDYFYQNLKEFSDDKNLVDSDFIDWGNDEKYEKAIGIGECAGVTIDLIQTLFFEAEEKILLAEQTLNNKLFADSIYHSYAAKIQAAKAILTSKEVRCNSQANIIETFDKTFEDFAQKKGTTFAEIIYKIKNNEPSETFAKEYLNQAKEFVELTKKWRSEQN